MAMKHSYFNSAFTQESEFYQQQQQQGALRNFRHSPVGAQTSNAVVEEYEKNVEEQDFYEEVIVDDNGRVKSKKLVVTQTPQRKNVRPQNVPKESDVRVSKNVKRTLYEDVNVDVAPSGMVHRYAVIEADDEEVQIPNKTNRYALIPLNELNSILQPKNNSRYEYISTSPVSKPQLPNRNRYEYIQNSPPARSSTTGGEYIPLNMNKYVQRTDQKRPQEVLLHSSTPRRAPNPKVASPTSSVKHPLVTRSVSLSRQQRNLCYGFGAKQLPRDNKHTAVVTPICSSPTKSVYGETTYNPRDDSWRNLSGHKPTAGRALIVAAFMMFLCGSVTTGLCFYMISIMGRLYFLDFGVVAGFTCVVLGLLGFRSRNVHWLPNRNYISGYLVLSLFSLLSCAGLLVLLVEQPRPGTLLADMTSGAVCGISALSLILAAAGVISSYCCKYPPPDNRVEHCSPGFTI